jgi:hypothetical protein
MPVKATARPHPLDDPELVREICARLDVALAELREIRVTIKKAKRGSR